MTLGSIMEKINSSGSTGPVYGSLCAQETVFHAWIYKHLGKITPRM